MTVYEMNFDGLVGPTHNYSGLSFGNVASKNNAKQIANPKKAALQGLEKMLAMTKLGLKQGILPPQVRPDTYTLRKLGFSGSDKDVITKAAKNAPQFLKACYSASSMWSANAATVSNSLDCDDGKVHFTPANLSNKLHRAIEAEQTSRTFKAIFNNTKYFTHHEPLPHHPLLGDEGAANHTRLSNSHSEKGLSLFVYGEDALSAIKPKIYPARQTLAASEAVARAHGLSDADCLFVQQNPNVIDQGVFHNDVIAIGNENVLLYHEMAFYQCARAVDAINTKYQGDKPLHLIEVSNDYVSVEDAVSSYIFNSQLITLPNGTMAIVAPTECQNNDKVATYLATLCEANNPISQVIYFDLQQSMKNGGGPACLRLRVPLNELELSAVVPECLMDEAKYHTLTAWVEKHYRDAISEDDLADPSLLVESQTALDELSKILKLGSIYPFQME